LSWLDVFCQSHYTKARCLCVVKKTIYRPMEPYGTRFQPLLAGGKVELRFNRDKIKKAGHPDTVICVITNPGGNAAFEAPAGGNVEAGKDVVAQRSCFFDARVRGNRISPAPSL
ncbi:MAG: hypothetical protein MR698_05245, partial [Selenomonas sp.]|nr:hypothetical protein [Selenomonas sp.]